MRPHFKEKVRTSFIRFIQVQLFISLISIPILISWGIPVSLLTPLGNIIFTPILILFIVGSCLLFFSELLHIPNVWLVHALDQLTQTWLYLIKFSTKNWLVGFALPAWPLLLLLVPTGAFAILHYRKNIKIHRSIASFMLLLMAMVLYLKLTSVPKTLVDSISCNNGHVTLIKKNNMTVLVDPGVIGQRLSMPSWIDYSLRPEIIKRTGALAIDCLIVLQPGKLTFEAIELICEKFRVKYVYLISWQGRFSPYEWRSFMHMKEALAKNNIELKRIGHQEKILLLPENYIIRIKPSENLIKKKDISFRDVQVTCQIDNHFVTIYSAKHKDTNRLCKRNICPTTVKSP